MKRTPLKRTIPLLARRPMRTRSRKTARLYREKRGPLVRALLGERPYCQRCGVAGSEDVHELLPRGRGGDLLDLVNLRALCRDCHRYIHHHPAESAREGWLISRWRG